MYFIKHVFLTLFFIPFSGFAQLEGDSLFATDQVMTIELTFSQTGYWDSLEANYTTSTYMSADMTITTLDGTRTFPNIAVRLKGNSTYNHPNNKKPFKIDFNKYVSGQDFDGIKKLNLSNGFKDPSCMREKLFFDFCHEVGVNAPRANFANLIINGSPLGFYTVVEQIDDQFLDWAILDDDGNLFKAGDNFGGGPGGAGTPADLMYYGNAATDYTDRYELKTNEDLNDWTDFIELLNYINNSTDTDFKNQFHTRFEKQELLRAFAIDNLFSNLDSYTGSARNYYLYHNLTTNKWEWIKWDANEAFGSYTNNQAPLTLGVDYQANNRPLLERIFDNEDLNRDYKNELCALVEDYFNNAYMDSKIDAIYNLIKTDVYADVNKMFSDADFDNNIDSDITSIGGPGGGNSIYGLKSFISSRELNVLSQVDCNYYNSIQEIHSEGFKLYPNPVSDFALVEFEGEIAQIELRSITGQLIKPIELLESTDKIKVPVSDLPEGIYLIVLSTGNATSIQKLMVNR
ncbi:MAG: CotH kinase family protein [Crocinitomicaceae bacterium]|nr:CotH kinase family protein [Crocinitomicaceae bacterium]